MVMTGRRWEAPEGIEHALVELKSYDGSHTHHWKRRYDAVLCVAPLPLVAPVLDYLPESDGLRMVCLSSNNAALLQRNADYAALRDAEARLAASALDTVILQPTAIAGRPGCPVLGYMSDRVASGRTLWLPGADTVQQPVHYRDVADAMLRALSPRVSAGTYSVAGPEARSYGALAREVECAFWTQADVRDVPVGAARALGRLLPSGREGAALRRAGVDRLAVAPPLPGFTARRGIADMLRGLTGPGGLPS